MFDLRRRKFCFYRPVGCCCNIFLPFVCLNINNIWKEGRTGMEWPHPVFVGEEEESYDELAREEPAACVRACFNINVTVVSSYHRFIDYCPIKI